MPAVGQGENFILSDISATLKYTKDYYVLEDGDIVEISPEAIHIYDSSLSPVSRELSHAHWNVEQAQKGGFDHFMLKEIYEQPEAFSKTVVPHVKDGLPNFERDEILRTSLRTAAISRLLPVVQPCTPVPWAKTSSNGLPGFR